MHTLIALEDGMLNVRLETEGQAVEETRWRAAIRPAIAILRALGGGGLLVPHRPHELA